MSDIPNTSQWSGRCPLSDFLIPDGILAPTWAGFLGPTCVHTLDSIMIDWFIHFITAHNHDHSASVAIGHIDALHACCDAAQLY